MSNLQDELSRHFAGVDYAEKQSLTESAAKQQKAEEVRTHVVNLMQAEILPAMNEVRDFLLNRNLPAETKLFPDLGSGTHSAVVGLYCSKDIGDYGKPIEQMTFRAAYILDAGKVYYATNRPPFHERLNREDEYRVEIPLEGFNATDANTRLANFVKAAFPLPNG
jgi:hypothetical protein